MLTKKGQWMRLIFRTVWMLFSAAKVKDDVAPECAEKGFVDHGSKWIC